MRPLSHIHIAHMFWQQIVAPGDTVIDATAGNGHDSHFLASLALNSPEGRLIAFDVQQSALDSTKSRLKEFDENQITLHLMSHSQIGEVCSPYSAKLIAFNLGYLPGGDKSLTTHLATTMIAIRASLELVVQGGMISITCYPGHDEGLVEEEAIVAFCKTLDAKQWSISSHTFLNRHRHPHLLLLQRII